MPRRREPRREPRRARKLVLAAARFLAWLNDLATVLTFGYIIKRWPENGGAVSAGIVGTIVAMIHDSWEMVAYADPTRNFYPLTPARAVLHDLFSMGVCMGGLILLLFTDVRDRRSAEGIEDQMSNDWRDKRHWFTIGQWMLTAVAILRFLFAIWTGFNCSNTRPGHERSNHRHRPRPERGSSV